MLTEKDIRKTLQKIDSERLNLSGNEKAIIIAIMVRINEYGKCTLSNEQLARHLGCCERAITKWLAHLMEVGMINIKIDKRKHQRAIYISTLERYQTPTLEEMSEAQKKFKQAFPTKEIDAEVPVGIDMDALIEEIKRSNFLTNADNVTLKSCVINHYDRIMAGRWRNAEFISNTKTQSNFSTGRNYTKEEMNSLFQDVNEIEI